MKVLTACPLDCPDSCSLQVTVEMGRIVDIDAAPVDTCGQHAYRRLDMQEGKASRAARVFTRTDNDPSCAHRRKRQRPVS